MWNSGIIQGLMWRTYNGSGTLSYSFIETVVAMKPYYVARAVGGLFFLAGAVTGLYNIWMTIREPGEATDAKASDRPLPRPSMPPALQAGE
jgi:cytochrome c oxidase cbb3-type subunit 1